MKYTGNEFEILARPPDELLDEMHAHVANGGTLHGLAETWGVRAFALYAWVDKDPVRKQRMKDAHNARLEWGMEVVWEFARDLATFKVTDLFEPDGKIKPMDQWPAAAARAVTCVETEELFDYDPKEGKTHIGTAKKIKVESRQKTVKMLGDLLGMFVQKVEHSGNLTLEQLVAQAREPKP